MRRKDTTTDNFRRLLREIAQLLAYEVTRDLPIERWRSRRRSRRSRRRRSAARSCASCRSCAPATACSTACWTSCPPRASGHIGLYRDPETLAAVEYYFKMPEDIAERLVIVVDPMLATGHSAVAALTASRRPGPRRSSTSACWRRPRASRRCTAAHPDVPIYTAAVDDHLNEHGYIVPGLGDAGDRLFGTK